VYSNVHVLLDAGLPTSNYSFLQQKCGYLFYYHFKNRCRILQKIRL